MKNAVVALLLLVASALMPVSAGATESLTWDHIHLAVPDTHVSTEWYIRYLGASPRPDGLDGVFFGPIRFNMRKAPPVAGSAGSVIDAIGLSYPDLDARMKMLDGSGAKVLAAPHTMPGIGKMAVIEDPWGTKIELVQDAQLLGFHHARVRSTDPAAMPKWFVETLGAETGKVGADDALKFGGIWLLIDKAATQPRASDGTPLDHLGFRTKDIKAEIADLQAKGVKVLGEPRQDPNVATTSATFFEGATGRTELTQR